MKQPRNNLLLLRVGDDSQDNMSAGCGSKVAGRSWYGLLMGPSSSSNVHILAN